ncbi:hypothetical protein PtA15_4A633 [Puccinia triticina]|uniref:Uncharacterized protein n=1 Tax=Puccinia triticina TaxID=208348 RepID=A0ABY7CG32_9BASI|nr:uncharacterized protein PtA15_4A633 [Puccinia triticina]WAQ84181.1 hypothetical protein PtA15_4A633 [Puccinia triticina]
MFFMDLRSNLGSRRSLQPHYLHLPGPVTTASQPFHRTRELALPRKLQLRSAAARF